MASRAVAADEVLRDFDAEEALRAELEALGEDVCSSEEERFAEDGARDARGAAGDPARSPRVGRAWGWDRDPMEDVQRAWSRREARLRRNSASRLGDDDDESAHTFSAPRGDDAPASSASASSGDETSSEGETRETRAAFLRAYEARERTRAEERESRRAAARRDAEAAETGAEAERAAAAARAEAAEAETAPDVFERRPEGRPSSAGTDAADAAEPRVPERARCAPASEAAASEELSAAAALAIQSRWRGVAVRRRLRRARDAARRRAAEEASSFGDPFSFAGVDEAVYTPPAGLDLDAEETPLLDAEATETERTQGSRTFARKNQVAPLGGSPAPRRAPRGSAPRIAAALEAAATEWGFRASGPAEEAFLRHRARLHVEGRRRARREQLKDPLERIARFRAVAAATAPKKKR